jgi:hypothetical protein
MKKVASTAEAMSREAAAITSYRVLRRVNEK